MVSKAEVSNSAKRVVFVSGLKNIYVISGVTLISRRWIGGGGGEGS